MALTAYADADHAGCQDTRRSTSGNTMTDAEHAPAMAYPPVERYEQIVPRNRMRAFTASSTIPAIYIQQFWDTICFDSKVGSYKCQLDEQWFNITQDTLRDALQITPVDKNRAFSSPPTPDTLVEFVNKLGYPKEVIHLSNVTTNDMFQPWRALATIINLCLTGKTSGFERPRKDKGSWQHTLGPRRSILFILIRVIRFTKLILFHLQRLHNFHPRPDSPLHLPTEEPVLGRLKFSAKGSQREMVDEFVEGRWVPSLLNPELRHRRRQYYKGAREGERKVGEEQAAQVLLNLQTPKKKSSAEQYIFQRRSHIPTETTGREDSTSLYAELGLYGSDTGTRDEGQAGSNPGTLDEGQAGSDPGTRDEGQAGPNPDDINIAESLPLPTPSVLAGPNLELSDVEITGPSSQPQPEHMDEGFTASAYPDVHKNLKLTVDEQVIPEEPVSSTGTLSSLQHLAKDFSFGDQFLNDKPSEADNEKTTADTEAESMASVTIQQDTSITPPMTSPVIDLVSRPHSPNVHWPLPTTTITTAATTTMTLPLPPQLQQGSSESLLIKRMGELEQHIADRVEENQALESRLDKQGSRIRKLETMDWSNMIREETTKFIESHEIDRKIEESVKDVVSLSVKQAMRAPLRARFKDLPTSDMKEILLQRMLEENYDKGHAEHRIAYEALQGSIHRDEDEVFDDDKAQEETKKKGKQDSPKPPPGSPPSPPPPPPPPSGASGASGTTGASDSAQAPPPPPPVSSTRQEDQSTGTAAPSSSKTAASAEYSAWTTTDSQNKPSITQYRFLTISLEGPVISTSESSRFGPARTLGVGNGRDSAMLVSSGFGPAWPSSSVRWSDPAWPPS
ncbi:hypothetical protein Tco_1237161 [Tanacetum coccineum]